MLLLPVLSTFGQYTTDSIEVGKALGTVFRLNGKNLTPRQLLEITRSNDAAYEEMKIAKSNFDIASVFGFAGGFLVGWPIGTALAGGNPAWGLAGIGAGLIVLSIPFSTAYSKHAKVAVRIYNSRITHTGLNYMDINFGITTSGVGIKVEW